MGRKILIQYVSEISNGLEMRLTMEEITSAVA